MFWIESLWLTIILWFCGIFLLIVSAEKAVQRSLDLAYHYGLSEVFIWLTILSIGTSIPEIASNIIGWFGILSWTLDPHIIASTVISANVWSSIVQQTLVTGMIVVVLGHIRFKRVFLAENYVALIVSLLIVFIVSYDGLLSRSDCLIMLLVFVLYMYFLYNQEHRYRHNHYEQIAAGTLIKPFHSFLWLAIWFVGIFIGSNIALHSVEYIVTNTSISGWIIGVLTLGIAWALPELITCITAMKKDSEGIAIGTIIGSNIVNPLMGIGLWGLVGTYMIPQSFLWWDIPVQIITACILLLWLRKHHRTIPKSWWIILILVYIIYILVRVHFFSTDL